MQVSSKQQATKARKAKVGNTAVKRPPLDSAARAYARLLEDPCYAPLCNPVYSGGEGGYLVRGDSYGTVVSSTGTAGTDTAGFLLFTPGAIGTTQSEVVGGANAASSGNITVASTSTTLQAPCRFFLGNSASAVRCVAACVKVSFLGTESERKGRIFYGHASGSVADVGDVVTTDSMAQLCQHYSRTPADVIELVWKPNDADQLFTDPTATTLASEKDRKASLLVAWTGLPAGVTLSFHLTAIWEWQPVRNYGLSVPTLSKSPSDNTLDQVINFIIEKGFPFVRHAASTISAVYGLMPARTTTVGRNM